MASIEVLNATQANVEAPVEIQLSLGNPIYRGPEGKKPVKGVDYFTQEDIDSIVAQIKGGEGIDLDGYATKEYVNEAVSGVVVSETDPTVPEWAKQAIKPTYTANEVGALPADTVLFSGSYNDLTDKPTIPEVPTNVSAFSNDAGYLTEHQSLNDYATKSYVETAIRGAESGLLKRSVVQELPTSDIDEDTIYMVAKTGSTGDVYDEYLYVNSNWEHIGSTDVDLTDYKKFIQINSNITYNYNDDTITALKQYFSSNSVRAEFPQIYFNNSLVFFTRTYSNAEYRGLPCLYYLSIGDYGQQQEFKYVKPTCDGDNVRYNVTTVIKQYSSDDVVVPKNYTVSNSSYDNKLSYELRYIKNNYATQSYVDTSMPEYLTNSDILTIWNGENT